MCSDERFHSGRVTVLASHHQRRKTALQEQSIRANERVLSASKSPLFVPCSGCRVLPLPRPAQ
jgi:hypothetical protein